MFVRKALIAGNLGCVCMLGRKRMVGFPALKSPDEALQGIRANLRNPSLETLNQSIDECLGRICAEDVLSPVDVPAFNRSAVDGYAVVASDTLSASPTNPMELRVVGELEAGASLDRLPTVKRGETIQILTGAPSPLGADAVVMVEYAKRTGDHVDIQRPVAPLQNVSKKGEDYSRGDLVMKKGTRVKPWHIAALASLNITSLLVYRRLRISILSTGEELVDPGTQLPAGKIINSSKPMLKALALESGCEPIDLGTVSDELELTSKKIAEGLEIADMVIVTGGTSLGERDLVPEAINSLGRPGLIVHGMKIRPAKPTGVGFVKGKPIFMLSGFPVSALIGFQLLVLPTVQLIQGSFQEVVPQIRARLTRRVTTPAGTRSFVRVKVVKEDGSYAIEPLMLTGSGLLSTLTKANALLVVPEGVEGFDEGEEVVAEMIQAPEAAV